MIKQNVSRLLRLLHLSKTADNVRFYFMYLKNFVDNYKFKKKHPDVILPPNYLMYESFQLNNNKYYSGGKEDALWVTDLVRPYITLQSSNILDWGCGPARIIRHLPGILGTTNKYFGSDYNASTVKWCKQHFPNISFTQNKITPPLDFSENYFQFIYGISVLTHLSRTNQDLWSKELNRIIAPEGLILLTTQGEAFMEKLTAREISLYKNDELVSRGNAPEGHRVYAAFQPPAYIRKVFIDSGFEIVSHIPGKRVTESYISQDVWLLKMKSYNS